MSEQQGGRQVVIPPRPQAESYAKFGDVVRQGTIGDVLSHPEMMLRLKQAVPKHLSPERMLRVLTQAIQKTPKLAQCTPASLLGAMMVCASLGLEPNTPLSLAHLIPFEKRGQVSGKWVTVAVEVQLIIGYRGYVDLALRSDRVISIHADCVYPGDEFSFEYGSRQHLHHKPKGSRDQEPECAYAHAMLAKGEVFIVLPWAEVIKRRNGSQAYQQALRARDKPGGKGVQETGWKDAPWVKHPHPMGAKTAMRDLADWLPLSVEFSSAAQLDRMSDSGTLDLQALTDMTSVEDMASVGAIEDQSGEQQQADFVEQGMQQQADQQQPSETAQQTQDAPQQQQREAKPKGGKTADQPKPTPAPPPPPAPQQQAGEKDVDLTCMPFTIEIVNLDGESTEFELPGAIKEFEQAFIETMRAFAKAGQLAGFIDSHGQAIKDMKADTPNLFERTKAEYDRLAPPEAEEQQDRRQSVETIRDEEPEPGLPADEDEGPAQDSFV